MLRKKLKKRIRQMLRRTIGRNVCNMDHFDADVIAFDVFDTLIFRDGVYYPTDVFDVVGQKLNINSFKNSRVNAEQRARKNNADAGGEALLEEIYDTLASDMGWDKHFTDTARGCEIETELDLCRADGKMKKLFNSFKEQERKVVIISDMYLSSETIRCILKKEGYNLEGVDLFISSEFRCSKRNGGLYKKVIDKLQIDADRIIMIGDNIISDYMIPKKLGMNAYLYKG